MAKNKFKIEIGKFYPITKVIKIQLENYIEEGDNDSEYFDGDKEALSQVCTCYGCLKIMIEDNHEWKDVGASVKIIPERNRGGVFWALRVMKAEHLDTWAVTSEWYKNEIMEGTEVKLLDFISVGEITQGVVSYCLVSAMPYKNKNRKPFHAYPRVFMCLESELTESEPKFKLHKDISAWLRRGK